MEATGEDATDSVSDLGFPVAAKRVWEAIWALGSLHVSWARPMTFVYISIVFVGSAYHFTWRYGRRGGWRQFVGSTAVRLSSSPVSWHVPPDLLLAYRAGVFVYCFWTLIESSFYEGPMCLRFFTVWNFAALVAFFALGTGLSCSCCRDVATIRERPSAIHRHAAAAHHLLLAVELPMSAMITACVWLVLYPHEHARTPGGGDLSKFTNLTSLTMHAANLVFMLVEFALDSMWITPAHIGLVLAWGMLYALFNGLQVYWTGDIVYFFMDFTLAKTPFVAFFLTVLMICIFHAACALSALKWRLLLGDRHPRNPHHAMAHMSRDEGLDGAGLGGGPTAEILAAERDGFGLDHPAVPYLAFANS